jgi:hypothetical protein
MFIGPAALATSPALIRSCQGSPVIGTRRATGWPRSVISIDSPAATSSRYLLACRRNTRTPIVLMCYMVAHVITDQPPRRFAIPDKRPLPQASIPSAPSRLLIRSTPCCATCWITKHSRFGGRFSFNALRPPQMNLQPQSARSSSSCSSWLGGCDHGDHQGDRSYDDYGVPPLCA